MLRRTQSLLLSLALVSCVLCWSVSLANAQVPIGNGILDVEYSVGTGSNVSYVVVDFGGSPASNPGPGDTYAYGYRWDNSATVADALLALTTVPGGLEVDVTDFGGDLGLNVDRLAYLGDDDTPVFNVDNRFWNFYQGSLSVADVTWDFSEFTGISGTSLTDGSFSGFRAQTFELADPAVPITAAVPEPNSALCWLVVAGALSIKRRRRR